MTVSVLRPDSTTSNTYTLTGGASAHAILNDNSDASYLTGSGTKAAQLLLGDLTLPANALIKSRAVRVRCRVDSGGGTLNLVVSVGHPIHKDEDTLGISWSTPTTVTALLAEGSFTDAETDDSGLWLSSTVGPVYIHEAYVDITYVILPVVTVSAPTGAITTTNLPAVTWSNALDSDGGAQTRYQVKFFTAAQYGIGGFDPAVSPNTQDSGVLTGASLTWTPTTPIADGTYRAYVRTGQTVNGAAHWSAWAYSAFTLAVALPAVPTFTATADSANARITLALDDNAGAATTDVFEVQRSLDAGVTWETVRQLVTGYLTPVAGVFTLYDYESPNGVETEYRARALHNYSGLYAASAWTSTQTATWSSTSWRLSHPNLPALNIAVRVRSFQTVSRAGRTGTFQPLGSSSAVVVADTRGPITGSITFRLDSLAEQAALDVLLDTTATLMLQSPLDEGGPGYVRFGSHGRQRVVDWADASRTFDTLDFTAVDSPPGNVVAWPVVRTNLVFNPSIEVGTATYGTSNAATLADGASIARVTSEQVDRTASLQVTTSASAQGSVCLLNGSYAVGVPYTFSVYLKGTTGAESLRVMFGDFDEGDWHDATFAITSGWVRYSFTWTPANAVVTPGFTVRAMAASVWYQDAHMVEQAAAASAYGDGETSGWAWNGTPEASSSTGS